VGELSGKHHLSWVASRRSGLPVGYRRRWSDRLAAMGLSRHRRRGCFIATLVDPYAWQAVVFTSPGLLCTWRGLRQCPATVGLLLNSAGW